MRPMSERKAIGLRVATGALCALGFVGLVACGGGAKGADSPGNCPEGTVLKGSDCVPPETGGHATASDDSSPASGGTGTRESSGGSNSSAAASPDPTPAPAGNKLPYDKESVEVELKRASRQVKANCGSATDDSGSAPGPWGKTSASVTLGRNGHVKDVTIPAPYDGQPDGVCVVNAFKKIQFPPYASSSDVVIEWDIELVKPKH
jgi:hypothetical protein